MMIIYLLFITHNSDLQQIAHSSFLHRCMNGLMHVILTHMFRVLFRCMWIFFYFLHFAVAHHSQSYIISLYFSYFIICIYRTRLSIEILPSNINFLFIFTRNPNRTNLFLSLHVWIYAIMWKFFFSLQISSFFFVLRIFGSKFKRPSMHCKPWIAISILYFTYLIGEFSYV